MSKMKLVFLLFLAVLIVACTGCVTNQNSQEIIDIETALPDIDDGSKLTYFADEYVFVISFIEYDPYHNHPMHCSLKYTFCENTHDTKESFEAAAAPFFDHIVLDSKIDGYPVGFIGVSEWIDEEGGYVHVSRYTDWWSGW